MAAYKLSMSIVMSGENLPYMAYTLTKINIVIKVVIAIDIYKFAIKGLNNYFTIDINLLGTFDKPN